MSEYQFAEPAQASTATLGKDYLIHLNTGGVAETPTWTLLGGQRSASLSRSAEEIDVSHKTSGGWKAVMPGLRSWSIDLESVYLASDEGASFLEAAFTAGKPVYVKLEYPDKSYVTGFAAINSFDMEAPNDDACTIKGTLNGIGALSERKTD